MKTIGARELQQRLRETFDDARQESFIVTRHGKPIGLLVGFDDNWDLEDVVYATSPGFWRMIAESRQAKGTRTIAEMRRRLTLAKPRRQKKR